jgi:hypothetical protein
MSTKLLLPLPLVSLGLVLVVSTASLQHGLVSASTTGNKTNHSSAAAGNGLLGTRWQSDSGHTLISVLGHNDSVVTRSAGQLATVTCLGLDIANNGTLRDRANGDNVSNGNLGYNTKHRVN